MTLEEFNSMTSQDLQSLHARHHLLVTGYPEPYFGFDEAGLGTLAPPTYVFTLHGNSYLLLPSQLDTFFFPDFSIKVGKNQNIRHKMGTTAHILRSHRSPQGKILNALDFPRPHLDHPPTSLSSDLFAFRRNSSNQNLVEEYPDLEMRWGLAATAGAFSTFHVDSHGRATYISCVNKDGSKFWVLAGTKNNVEAPALESIENVINFYNNDVPSLEDFPDVQLEAVLLEPGMRL